MTDLPEKKLNPLVSIIVPIFNQADFLREAVERALAQTHQNCELLLVDDGSEDISAEIARDYAARFPARVFFLKTSEI